MKKLLSTTIIRKHLLAVLAVFISSVTLAIPPAITTQPLNTSVCVGNNADLVTIASNTTSYQWQVNTGSGFVNVVNGGVYSGATTFDLAITGATLAMNGYKYRCIATGPDNPPATSNEVTLTVNQPAVITSQFSSSAAICSGSNASFTVTATGTITGYQWYIHNGVSYVPLTNGGVYSGATSNVLNITGITVGANTQTFSYFCSVSGPCGGAVTTPINLTVNALPAISTQPSTNIAVCDQKLTVFEINATGANLTYQWQVSYNGFTWGNLTNNATYSRVDERAMEINANMGINQTMYRCMVTGTCPPAAVSQAGTLTVKPRINIGTQPVNSTVCPGTSTDFAVIATGTSLTYQWQSSTNNGGTWNNVTNGGIYGGATTYKLSLTNVSLANNNTYYRCIVGSECDTVISLAGLLKVPTPVSIVSMPDTSETICSGQNVSFSVSAAGDGLTYKWYILSGLNYTQLSNGGVYSGATTATLNINGITATPGHQVFSYFCSVSGTCGGDVTEPSYLHVNALPAVTAQPSNTTVCEGQRAFFEVTANVPDVTFQWQVSTNGGGTWTNLSNNSIYSRVTERGMEIATTASLNNNMYRCVVTGVCSPAANSNGATLTVNTSPVVNSQPANKTICSGANTTFTVGATGTGLNYKWQILNGSTWTDLTNTGIYSTVSTSTLNITGATTAVNGARYRCVVSGTCPSPVNSGDATLTIQTAPVVNTPPASVSVCPSGNTSFTVAASGSNLTYQWEINTGSGWATLNNGGKYSNTNTTTLNITGATISENGNQYRCVVSGSCTPSVTSGAATLTINTVPAVTTSPTNKVICLNDNTTFSVTATGTGINYQWEASTNGINWGAISNSATYSGVTTPTMTITAAGAVLNGNRYRCVVSGACTPAATSGFATLTVNNPTVLTGSPSNSTICEGNNITFSASATGSNIAYQWEINTGSGWSNVSNGGIYAGATTGNLVLTNVPTTANGYQYRCTITGACAPTPVTTGAATLTVRSNVVIGTQPVANTTICSGGNASLTCNATGTGVSYQWYVYNGTSYTAITNGGNYSGATTSTLNITGMTASPNARTLNYYCQVNGTCNSASSNQAYLLVNAAPLVNGNPSNRTVCDSATNVAFSVTATGTGLTYQWQRNTGSGFVNISNDANTSGATTNSLLLNYASVSMSGYQYRCVVSGTCSPSYTSGSATLTVNPRVMPSVTISCSDTDICAGTLVTFTAAPTNGGITPIYQWKIGGVNAGTNSPTFVTTSLTNSQYVSVEMKTSVTCPLQQAAYSNPITMKVTSYATPTVTVASSSGNTECSGVPVTFSTATTFAGTAPTYQWQVNGVNVGSTATTYLTDSLNDADVVRCIMTSNFECPTVSTVASNNYPMTINQTTPATVTISDSRDTTVCLGREVTLYAYYNNSGPTPQFQWIKNGANILNATSASYTTTGFVNGDVIKCLYTSGALCVFPVESDTLHMTVTNPVMADVKLAISYKGGNTYTFTATPVNGGTNPTYTFLLNGNPVGPAGISNTYTSGTLKPSDVISVIMNSNHPCVISDVAQSRNVTTSVAASEVFTDLVLYPNPNSGRFTVQGQYSGAGSTNAKITVLNTLGQVVHLSSTKVNGGKLNAEVALEGDATPGMYMMRIEIDGRMDLVRFTISK